MPRLSDTMEQGTVARWLKHEGDEVAEGDVVAEIETDKATMELQSYVDGVLLQILVGDGERAALGAPIALVGAQGEEVGGSRRRRRGPRRRGRCRRPRRRRRRAGGGAARGARAGAETATRRRQRVPGGAAQGEPDRAPHGRGGGRRPARAGRPRLRARRPDRERRRRAPDRAARDRRDEPRRRRRPPRGAAAAPAPAPRAEAEAERADDDAARDRAPHGRGEVDRAALLPDGRDRHGGRAERSARS